MPYSDLEKRKAYQKSEKRKEYGRNYQKTKYALNKGKVRQKYSVNTQKRKFYSYRSRAMKKQFGFEFDFSSFNDILKKDCHYCGKKDANGIDRVDNRIGYVTGNVLPCCARCNFMKLTLSYTDFINHIKTILKNLSKGSFLGELGVEVTPPGFLHILLP